MNITKIMLVFIFTVFSSHALAYGSSSSSKKACNKPTFTEFSPSHLQVVAPQSEFSFLASASTDPETIDVRVKKLPVDLLINKLSNGYLVKGTLPESLTNTYARVEIKATAINNCKGDAGWLLKIEP